MFRSAKAVTFRAPASGLRIRRRSHKSKTISSIHRSRRIGSRPEFARRRHSGAGLQRPHARMLREMGPISSRKRFSSFRPGCSGYCRLSRQVWRSRTCDVLPHSRRGRIRRGRSRFQVGVSESQGSRVARNARWITWNGSPQSQPYSVLLFDGEGPTSVYHEYPP